MDGEFLSRLQFALNIMFHYIFPPMSVGLGLMLVIIEGIYLKTRNPLYRQMAKFWTRVFALTFSLGVATGLVMIFAFGTNWAPLSRFMGDVFGSIVGAEGVFAFTAESGFLGLLLFGWNRISDRMHFFATCMVAIAAHFSALWIVIANSWMQTPVGHKIVNLNGVPHAVIDNWWTVLMNHSSLDRIVHVYLGCWLTGSFLVISVAAYYLLKKRHINFAMQSMRVGLIVAGLSVLLQGISGDSTAKGVSRNQPAKLAAIEGVFKTEAYTPFNFWGVVNEEKQQIDATFAVPGMLSMLVYHNPETPVMGLDQVPKENWPPVAVVFQTYRIMLYMFGIMFILLVLAWIYWRRKALQNAKWLLRLLVCSVACPLIANETGWMTAEIGRQPWVIYGVLRTSDAFSSNVPASHVLASLIMFSIIYLALFFLFLFLLDRKIKHGPEEEEQNDLYRNYYKD